MKVLTTDFDILERPIETDNRLCTSFSPFECKDHFNAVKAKVEEMFTIIEGEMSEAQKMQYTMLLRAQFVFMIGAFDFYMHELTKYALDQMNRGNWICSPEYLKIDVPMKTVQTFMDLSIEEYYESFLEFITNRYSSVTLVNGDVVLQQLKTLGLDADNICKSCYPDCQEPKKEFTKTLFTLFDKRNKIAHQVDQSHMDASEYDISKTDVEHCIKALSLIVDNITIEVDEKNHQRDLKNAFLVWNFSEDAVGTGFTQFRTDYHKCDKLLNNQDQQQMMIIPFVASVTSHSFL